MEHEVTALVQRWRGGALCLIDSELGDEVATAGDEIVCGKEYQGQN